MQGMPINISAKKRPNILQRILNGIKPRLFHLLMLSNYLTDNSDEKGMIGLDMALARAEIFRLGESAVLD